MYTIIKNLHVFLFLCWPLLVFAESAANSDVPAVSNLSANENASVESDSSITSEPSIVGKASVKNKPPTSNDVLVTNSVSGNSVSGNIISDTNNTLVSDGTEDNAVPNNAANLAQVLLALLVVLAVIVLLAWIVKRFSLGGVANNAHLKVLAAMPIGTRERLMIVEAGGQQLLIGVTSTSVNTLHVYDQAVIESPGKAPVSDFNEKLKAVLKGGTVRS